MYIYVVYILYIVHIIPILKEQRLMLAPLKGAATNSLYLQSFFTHYAYAVRVSA